MQTFNFSKTLFVCTGNVYRSYISEQVFRGVCENIGKKEDITCWSRGTELYYDSPHPDIIKYCRSISDYVFNTNHVPELVKIEDVEVASIIIVFTQKHVDHLTTRFPQFSDKIVLFSNIFNTVSSITEDVQYDDVSITNSTLQFNVLSIIQAIENKFMMDRVSIIIPVHTEVKNISRLLEQLSRQLYHNDEIIVVSSGSEDGTDDAIKLAIKNNINCIKLIQQKTREGKVSALKLGMTLAKNKTLILTDGDIKVSNNFRSSIDFIEINTCYTGKVSTIIINNNVINKVSHVSTTAWNNLRSHMSSSGKFLYPSGYCMIMPRRYLQYALFTTIDTVINDDANIALELYKKNILFKYRSCTEVFVKFPQTWSDFLIQKVRTRIGRQQNKPVLYKLTEQLWRQQVILFLNSKYVISATILLIVDFTCRIVAKLKLSHGTNHHIWTMIKSSK